MRDEGKVPYSIRASSWILFDQGVSRHWTPWTWKANWVPSRMLYYPRRIQWMDAWMMRLVTSWKSRVNPV